MRRAPHSRDTNEDRTRYSDVLDSLRRLGPSTARELCADTGRSGSSVTRTMFVLVDLGLAVLHSKRRRATGGAPAPVWVATEGCARCRGMYGGTECD